MGEYSKNKYFWIKLTDSFLTSDTVDFLMSQTEGAKYVVLYQMICLKTVNNDGELIRKLGEIVIPYDATKIARDCKYFSEDTVRVALELYKKLGLIYEMESGVLRIAEFEKLIGVKTEGADKKQKQRNNKALSSGKQNGGQLGGQKVDKCPTEIDIYTDIRDKDLYKDKELYNTPLPPKGDTYSSQISEIISFLNQTVGASYKDSTPKTRELITVKIKQGFTVDNFKTVINKKCSDWKGTDFAKFLRPETLFGNKFEGYLNEKVKEKSKPTEYTEFWGNEA